MDIQVNTQLLMKAASIGNASEVERLIPLSDPKARHSLALWRAAENGHIECVKLLIPVSDPKSENSYALRAAADSGHSDCVRLLIPVSDPKAENSWALKYATQNGHHDCVDLLFDVSDPHKALDALQTEHPNEPKKWSYLERKISEQQNQILNNCVAAVKPRKQKPRKI